MAATPRGTRLASGLMRFSLWNMPRHARVANYSIFLGSCAKVNLDPFDIIGKLGQAANILTILKCVCCQALIHANKDDFEALVITAAGDDFSSYSDITQYLAAALAHLLQGC